MIFELLPELVFGFLSLLCSATSTGYYGDQPVITALDDKSCILVQLEPEDGPPKHITSIGYTPTFTVTTSGIANASGTTTTTLPYTPLT